MGFRDVKRRYQRDEAYQLELGTQPVNWGIPSRRSFAIASHDENTVFGLSTRPAGGSVA
jgi:hypothetical protein